MPGPAIGRFGEVETTPRPRSLSEEMGGYRWRGGQQVLVAEGEHMFNTDDAIQALSVAGIDISDEKYDIDAVTAGMNVELEHGKRFPDLDVTGNDPVVTVKIALAHLREFPDYYERLEVMEREAEAVWDTRD